MYVLPRALRDLNMERKPPVLESENPALTKPRNEYRQGSLSGCANSQKPTYYQTHKHKAGNNFFLRVEARANKKFEDAQLQLQVKMSRLAADIVR